MLFARRLTRDLGPGRSVAHMTKVRSAGSRWLPLLRYTLLRLALLIAAWAVIAWLTPVKGLWALALALLVSGAISLFVLDRQRDAMSLGVARFFTGINERIDAATRAEDAVVAGELLQDREAGAHDEPVGQHEDPRPLERGDE